MVDNWMSMYVIWKSLPKEYYSTYDCTVVPVAETLYSFQAIRHCIIAAFICHNEKETYNLLADYSMTSDASSPS
jgi:hypothetical protein